MHICKFKPQIIFDIQLYLYLYQIFFLSQAGNSNQNQVTLKNMNLDSAGQFRCEISAEAPLFNTVSQSRPLSVIGKSSYVFNAIFIQNDSKLVDIN